MSLKHLALIGTSGHYFNLLECLEQTGLQKRDTILILFTITSETKGNAFFDHSIDLNEWKKVKIISLWETNKYAIYNPYNIIRIVNYIIGLIRLTLWRKYDTVIVNQIDTTYYRIFYNLCNYQNIISMDEGNAVMRFIEQRNNSDINSFWLPLPDKIIFFSSYDIDVKASDKLISCSYMYSNRIIKDKDTNDRLVLFIGSPLVEDNIMDHETYMEYLQKVSMYYAGYEVVYIGHRREIPENLFIISERFHFSTLTLEKPVEMYFIEMEKNPRVITGFYSAAIYNLKKMTPIGIVSFESFYIDPKDNRKDSPELIRSIYDQFANVGIKIYGR
jgi:hypothetical protein